MCMVINANPVKFVRGQVWFVNENPEITKILRTEGSTVINGSRPYVVISVNERQEIVTCCPLTSNVVSLYKSPYDIVYKNPEYVSEYEESRICVSQITSKPFVEFTSYMYSLSSEAIDILMKNIRDCLGVSNVLNTIAKSAPIPVNIEEDTPGNENYYRVPKYDRSEWPLKTKEDAEKFLAEFGEMNGKKASTLLGVSKPTFYTLRWKANKLAFGKED